MSVLITVAVIVAMLLGLVKIYIEKIYDDPGAVSARELKIDAQVYQETVDQFEKCNHEDTFVVLIDPTHGGRDTGYTKGMLMEKDVVLDVALAAQQVIGKEKGIEVFLTRADDNEISEEQRNYLYEILEPDMFIELHLSKSADSKKMGTEAYYDSSFYDYRLNDAQFAEILIENMARCTEGAVSKVEEDIDENYPVLDKKNINAVVVSLGYISSEVEADALTSDAYIANLGQGLAEGIMQSYDIRNKTADGRK